MKRHQTKSDFISRILTSIDWRCWTYWFLKAVHVDRLHVRSHACHLRLREKIKTKSHNMSQLHRRQFKFVDHIKSFSCRNILVYILILDSLLPRYIVGCDTKSRGNSCKKNAICYESSDWLTASRFTLWVYY